MAVEQTIFLSTIIQYKFSYTQAENYFIIQLSPSDLHVLDLATQSYRPTSYSWVRFIESPYTVCGYTLCGLALDLTGCALWAASRPHKLRSSGWSQSRVWKLKHFCLLIFLYTKITKFLALIMSGKMIGGNNRETVMVKLKFKWPSECNLWGQQPARRT